MQTATLERPGNPMLTATPVIHVHHAAGGGWDVPLTRGGRVLALDHYADWHRVERSCRRLEAQYAIPHRPAALLAALLFVVLLLPAGVCAQTPGDTTTGNSSTLAQDLTTDAEIRRLVEARLRHADITGVEVTVHGAAVTLGGTVLTLAIKQKAIEEARDVSDNAPVISELIIPPAESDERLAGDVAKRFRRYVFFTIFDHVAVEVDRGLVRLAGRVTLPFKADAFVAIAARVAGVQAIDNTIRVLPASQQDDQLRYTIAAWIYGDPLFWHYSLQVNPPVHIIVEHGDVTLTGTVHSEVERRKAEVIARSTVAFSVDNQLRVEIDE